MINIYQSFFTPEQFIQLDRSFIPFNNLKNKNPELREFPLMKALYDKNKNFNGYWGLVSWKWKEKTNLDGCKFIEWVEDNPGYDVYHINPYFALTEIDNPFVDNSHEGMVEFTDLLLRNLGYKFSIRDAVFPLNIISSCSFYVANKKFWNHWIGFVETCIEIVKRDEYMNKYMFNDVTIHLGERVINYSFIIERLFGLFLFLRNSNFKVKHYPYSLRIDDDIYNQFPSLYEKGIELLKKQI